METTRRRCKKPIGYWRSRKIFLVLRHVIKLIIIIIINLILIYYVTALCWTTAQNSSHSSIFYFRIFSHPRFYEGLKISKIIIIIIIVIIIIVMSSSHRNSRLMVNGHWAGSGDWPMNHHHHWRYHRNNIFVSVPVHGHSTGNAVSLQNTMFTDSVAFAELFGNIWIEYE